MTALFNLFNEGEKQRLFSSIAAAMGRMPKEIEERQVVHFDRVHPDYGNGVRRAPVTADGTERPAISVTPRRRSRWPIEFPNWSILEGPGSLPALSSR